ncbi:unnamed protein product [Paramecium primaurelia]|uniref:Uncharacterized protein n=1 Tax=Paramecium primaurelia TaxID=5886 RepID=A0A8S1P930_PARPR|nr:unnamed protein product [Paramecium primaurelia]
MYNYQQQTGPGRLIFNNLRPLAAVKYLNQTNQKSIIYPLRKPKPVQNNQSVFRNQPTKGDLFFDPINHDGGYPLCTMSMADYKEDGTCPNCNKKFPLNQWYYDLSLAMIIMQFRNNQNKKDIIECVKYYDDGEYEILYTDYQEAQETDQYLNNDPIIDELIGVQKEILQRVGNNQNVILEQSPDLIENFTKIIESALKQ